MSAGDIHVMPISDSIEHEWSEDCACGPTPEYVTTPTGIAGFMLTHHSLDGREFVMRCRTHGPCINNPMCQCGCDDAYCPNCPGD